MPGRRVWSYGRRRATRVDMLCGAGPGRRQDVGGGLRKAAWIAAAFGERYLRIRMCVCRQHVLRPGLLRCSRGTLLGAGGDLLLELLSLLRLAILLRDLHTENSHGRRDGWRSWHINWFVP